MCDYSLHLVSSRDAQKGEELMTTRFPNTLTGGFAAPEEPTTAVCLQPGTEIAFHREVEYLLPFRWLLRRFGYGQIAERVATFCQINTQVSDAHHDALEFPNGRIVLLTRLCRGQRATVLQLPKKAQTTPSVSGHERRAGRGLSPTDATPT